MKGTGLLREIPLESHRLETTDAEMTGSLRQGRAEGISQGMKDLRGTGEEACRIMPGGLPGETEKVREVRAFEGTIALRGGRARR
mmetsp:Transcript_32234/g.102590  ORF Transcript_32234/g.102590 Transcript_32234/m.102590 type:complete len:85 (-) Transcript_32234:138-392(-)